LQPLPGCAVDPEDGLPFCHIQLKKGIGLSADLAICPVRPVHAPVRRVDARPAADELPQPMFGRRIMRVCQPVLEPGWLRVVWPGVPRSIWRTRMPRWTPP